MSDVEVEKIASVDVVRDHTGGDTPKLGKERI